MARSRQSPRCGAGTPAAPRRRSASPSPASQRSGWLGGVVLLHGEGIWCGPECRAQMWRGSSALFGPSGDACPTADSFTAPHPPSPVGGSSAAGSGEVVFPDGTGVVQLDRVSPRWSRLTDSPSGPGAGGLDGVAGVHTRHVAADHRRSGYGLDQPARPRCPPAPHPLAQHGAAYGDVGNVTRRPSGRRGVLPLRAEEEHGTAQHPAGSLAAAKRVAARVLWPGRPAAGAVGALRPASPMPSAVPPRTCCGRGHWRRQCRVPPAGASAAHDRRRTGTLGALARCSPGGALGVGVGRRQRPLLQRAAVSAAVRLSDLVGNTWSSALTFVAAGAVPYGDITASDFPPAGSTRHLHEGSSKGCRWSRSCRDRHYPRPGGRGVLSTDYTRPRTRPSNAYGLLFPSLLREMPIVATAYRHGLNWRAICCCSTTSAVPAAHRLDFTSSATSPGLSRGAARPAQRAPAPGPARARSRRRRREHHAHVWPTSLARPR